MLQQRHSFNQPYLFLKFFNFKTNRLNCIRNSNSTFTAQILYCIVRCTVRSETNVKYQKKKKANVIHSSSLINVITITRSYANLSFIYMETTESSIHPWRESPSISLPLIIFRAMLKKVLRLMLSQYLYLPEANCSKEILLFHGPAGASLLQLRVLPSLFPFSNRNSSFKGKAK